VFLQFVVSFYKLPLLSTFAEQCSLYLTYLILPSGEGLKETRGRVLIISASCSINSQVPLFVLMVICPVFMHSSISPSIY
jgi:hypothetical protein